MIKFIQFAFPYKSRWSKWQLTKFIVWNGRPGPPNSRRLWFNNKYAWRAVYTWDFVRCDCHPGVCDKLVIIFVARYPLMIHCSLSSTLSSNHTGKQPFRLVFRVTRVRVTWQTWVNISEDVKFAKITLLRNQLNTSYMNLYVPQAWFLDLVEQGECQ